MRKTDDEVLRYLRSDPSTPTEIDFLTYATYAQEKSAWLEDFRAQNGQVPRAEDEITWISNWTDLQFQRLRIQATDFFDIAARSYMEDEIDEAKKGVREEIIIREVKAAGSWWRQLLIALLTAILTPVVLALLVFATTHGSDLEKIILPH